MYFDASFFMLKCPFNVVIAHFQAFSWTIPQNEKSRCTFGCEAVAASLQLPVLSG
jgi:hypothetical protein